LGKPGIVGRIVKKWDMRVWAGSSWLRIGIVGRHL